jgi:hypothetical protein
VRVKEKVVVVRDLPAPAAPQAQVATTRSSGGHSGGRDRSHTEANEIEHGDENEVEDSDHEVEHEDSDHEDVGDDD